MITKYQSIMTHLINKHQRNSKPLTLPWPAYYRVVLFQFIQVLVELTHVSEVAGSLWGLHCRHQHVVCCRQ